MKKHIEVVAAIIVNGKYKVNTGSVSNNDECVELVTYLTKLAN